jgi:hypothetical protein
MDKITYVKRHRIKMLRLSIKENNMVFVVPMDSRWSSHTAKVLGIGKKYITIDSVHKGDSKFTIDNFENICSDGIPKYTLYASKEDYELCNTMRQEINYLTIKIKTGLPYLSPDMLQEILEIVDNNLVS